VAGGGGRGGGELVGGDPRLSLVVAGSGHGATYSAVLGGLPHASSHATQMVSVLTQLGFGLFPWVVLLPLAAARAFAGERDLLSDGKSDTSEPAPTPRIGGEIAFAAPGAQGADPALAASPGKSAAAGAPPEPDREPETTPSPLSAHAR